MPRFVSPTGQEDHRVRVARERRERTRAHLLDAVLSVYPGDGMGGPAVIDDVIRAAGVSRGTFYKYFPSLEDAVTELGNKLAQDLAQTFRTCLDDIPDPLEKMATAIQVCLLHAAVEPRWGMFVAHMNHLANGDNPALLGMIENLSDGLASGAFRFTVMDAAVDLAAGIMVEGIRRIIRGDTSTDYIEQSSAMLLRGLGATSDRAARAAAAANRRLHESGGRFFEWLPPIAPSSAAPHTGS